MPPNNQFRHQQYECADPRDNYALLCPASTGGNPTDDHRRAIALTDVLRKANVAAIYLIHGTFAGNDALGLLREMESIHPRAARFLRHEAKELFDDLAGNTGNYTETYARHLENAVNRDHEPRIPVHLFNWSSENNHVGRTDAAVQLIDTLVASQHARGQHILIWGHSHGGNVLALVTNLLATSVLDRNRFFKATRPLHRRRVRDTGHSSAWRHVNDVLSQEGNPLEGIPLDLVTFGTPVRYGWDTGGCTNLLHFVHHRAGEGIPEYQAELPKSVEDVVSARGGDYVQQLGIAGTDFLPYIFDRRSWVSEHRLQRLLAPGLRRRDLLDRLRCGRRVHHDGQTLLVEYAETPQHSGRHLAGHAVYTYPEWMLFHLEEIAKRFYDVTHPWLVGPP